MTLKTDSIMAKQKDMKVKICTKPGRGKKWNLVSFFETIEDAFVFAQSIEAYQVGILVSPPGHGGFIYWTSQDPELFNSTVVSMDFFEDNLG